MPTLMQGVPNAIALEVLNREKEIDWIGSVPAYVEFPDARGKLLWHDYFKLDVGGVEQATEFFVRRAHAAMQRWMRNGHSPRSAKTAAYYIVKARTMRCRYFQLLGHTGTAEEMVFPWLEAVE